MATFAQRLKSLRQETGYLQKEIAAKLSISRSTLGSWESGNRIPELGTAQRLADFFNVSVDYLLGRTDSRTERLPPETIETKKPKDLIRYLEQSEVMFDGEIYKLDEEGRAKVRAALELAFWDAKRRNKRKKPDK